MYARALRFIPKTESGTLDNVRSGGGLRFCCVAPVHGHAPKRMLSPGDLRNSAETHAAPGANVINKSSTLGVEYKSKNSHYTNIHT